VSDAVVQPETIEDDIELVRYASARALKEIREKSFLFEVEAYWGRILVGKGVYERRVVSVLRFMEKVRTMTP
jgi:predicted thioesterase